jgi:hypothetical protein
VAVEAPFLVRWASHLIVFVETGDREEVGKEIAFRHCEDLKASDFDGGPGLQSLPRPGQERAEFVGSSPARNDAFGQVAQIGERLDLASYHPQHRGDPRWARHRRSRSVDSDRRSRRDLRWLSAGALGLKTGSDHGDADRKVEIKICGFAAVANSPTLTAGAQRYRLGCA